MLGRLSQPCKPLMWTRALTLWQSLPLIMEQPRQMSATGVFEHHTGEINRAQLEDMLVKLAQGTLTNDEVFNTSGHGALILDQSAPAHQSSALPFLAVTGPRREMLRGSSLHPYEATPHGDMMLAGCFGLLRALADHEPEMAPLIEPSLLADD